jgi:sucrose-6F-phosphate phosphohydrolase
LKPVRLFSTDLDGTVVGDPAATQRFADFWQALPAVTRPLLVYNSGRLIDDQLELLRETRLPQPDFIIGGVGTMMSAGPDSTVPGAFSASLGGHFDATRIARVLAQIPGIEKQPEHYQHGFKSSWYLHDADAQQLATIEMLLANAKIEARIVYSSQRDLDILPQSADKGAAIAWLCRYLGIGLDETVVAGDTGNDRAMFELPDVRGIIVANALKELRQPALPRDRIFLARLPIADGVVEGLKHWRVHNR